MEGKRKKERKDIKKKNTRNCVMSENKKLKNRRENQRK